MCAVSPLCITFLHFHSFQLLLFTLSLPLAHNNHDLNTLYSLNLDSDQQSAQKTLTDQKDPREFSSEKENVQMQSGEWTG